ncbi:MAG: hypothetical protein WCK90_04210 [archaeon]
MGKLIPEKLYALVDNSHIQEVYSRARKGLEKYVSRIEARWTLPDTPKNIIRTPIFSLDLAHEGRSSSHYDIILMEDGSKSDTQARQFKDRDGANIGISWKLSKEKRMSNLLSAIMVMEIGYYLNDAILRTPGMEYPNSLYLKAAAEIISGLEKDPRKK